MVFKNAILWCVTYSTQCNLLRLLCCSALLTLNKMKWLSMHLYKDFTLYSYTLFLHFCFYIYMPVSYLYAFVYLFTVFYNGAYQPKDFTQVYWSDNECWILKVWVYMSKSSFSLPTMHQQQGWMTSSAPG